MKVTVHSVLFLCVLCVLIWGGVSFALQDKKTVVEKAKAAREVVDAAKVLGEKVKDANKDFAKDTNDFNILFLDAIKGVNTAIDDAMLITTGSPNKDEAAQNITGLIVNVIVAHNAAHALKNAEAASLKEPNKIKIDKNLEAVEKEMKSAEDAVMLMTGDYTSINKVVQKAEKLKKVVGDAVTFWPEVGKSVKLQKDAADTAVKKNEEAIREVAKSIKYVGENKDTHAAEAKTALETVVSAKLTTLLDKAKAIQAASIEAYTNVQVLVEKYGTVKTDAGELEQAAKESKSPTGSSLFLTGPLLSITFPVFFLCLCLLPLQW